MKKLAYYIERTYPYAIALIIVSITCFKKVSFVNDLNMNSALDGVNTTAALIIGFLGAILPVILGMKNESKIVKYVFESDSHRLFLKYIKSTIMTGLLLVAITVSLYFRNNFDKQFRNLCFYFWLFLLILFLVCTYRSLSNMLNLIFAKDSELNKGQRLGNSQHKTEEEKEIEKKYKF